MQKIIGILAGIVVLAGVLVGFLYFQARTARGLALTIDIPDPTIEIGVPFDVRVSVANNTSHTLQETRMTLALPNGVVFLGGTSSKSIQNKTIGSLGGGRTSDETFRVVALSGENAVRQVRATVTYSPSSLGAKFEQVQTKDFTVSQSGIAIDMVTPAKVFSGEQFELKVNFKNVSDIDFSNLELTVAYPPTFIFKSASRQPDVDNNVWDLGDLRKGDGGGFTIKGTLSGPDNAFFDFKTSMTAGFFAGNYVISEKTATVALSPSALSMRVELNDSPEYVVRRNDLLSYTLTYRNNTAIGLKDVVVRAKLIGEMFDIPSLQTTGSFQASDNTLVWNASQIPGLLNIPAGGVGSIQFAIRTKPEYPTKRLSDKNFIVKVHAEVESPTVPPGVASSRTIGQGDKESKVGGELFLAAFGRYRDAGSGILNKGAVPLKIGQPTQFTIHWQMKAAASDMENITLHAFLSRNVRYTGVAKSNTGSTPVYNERTQEVTWQISRVVATSGFLSDPVEAVFQVELTPSPDQLNQYPRLVEKTGLIATDVFIGEGISLSAAEISTQTLDDPSVGTSAQVQQ